MVRKNLTTDLATPETLKNLAKAFIGESQARNRYTMYSSVARKEGYEQIAEIFLLTAEQELEHAEWHYKLLNELNQRYRAKSSASANDITVGSNVPVVLGTTLDNLRAAISGENYEYTKMYPEFADVAKKEGYPEISTRLMAIARAEQHHEERFKKLLKLLEDKTIFKRDSPVAWVCRKCGYVHIGKEPPESCPSCGHPKNFYQLKCEEY